MRLCGLFDRLFDFGKVEALVGLEEDVVGLEEGVVERGALTRVVEVFRNRR